MKETYHLFLDDDDRRIPSKLKWIDLPNVNWTIARNFDQFINIINSRGVPENVSLDHDLGSSAYSELARALGDKDTINYSNIKEKTGYHCAEWLLNYCFTHNIPFPTYYIHSLNPIGKQNIINLIDSYNKNLKDQVKMWICVGAPGSGKSTWSKKLETDTPNVLRLCPDEYRAKFGWGEGDQTVSKQAFDAVKTEANSALENRKNVIIDATNMHKKARKEFLAIAKNHSVMTIAVIFNRDRELLIKRNIERGLSGGRNVPVFIIDSMLAKYEEPTKEEFNFILYK